MGFFLEDSKKAISIRIFGKKKLRKTNNQPSFILNKKGFQTTIQEIISLLNTHSLVIILKCLNAFRTFIFFEAEDNVNAQLVTDSQHHNTQYRSDTDNNPFLDLKQPL